MIKKYINQKIELAALNMKKGDALRKLKLPKISGYKKTTFAFKDNLDAFNIYEPTEVEVKKGLIIDIHGGAWIYGDIHLNDEYCESLSTKGYKVVSLDYPLLGQEDTNIQVIVNYLIELLNYIISNKIKFNLDFSRVLLTGDSAGAHLAMLVYSLIDSKELRNIYQCEKPKIESNNIKLITFCFPAIEVDQFINVDDESSKAILNYFKYLMCKDTNLEVKDNMSLSQIVKKVRWPKILLVSSKKDYFNFQSELAYKIFQENKVEIDYKLYPFDEKLDHVFNIGFYHYKESIEINTYMLQKFDSIE